MAKRPKEKSAKDGTSPFMDHGFDFEEATRGHSVTECFLCGKNKLYVNKETGAWDCKVCGESGGTRKFFEARGQSNTERFRGSVAKSLSKNRGIKVRTMRAARVGWDGNQYTIPADIAGKSYDLRRYPKLGGKVYATSRSTSSLGGIISSRSDTIWLMEGEWDGMAMVEALTENKKAGSVVWVPGANVLPSHAIPLFQGKRVKACFDNDEPGQKGLQRVANLLGGIAKTVQYVHWPEGTSKGFDFRDMYIKRGKSALLIAEKILKKGPPGAVEEADQEQFHFDGKGMSREDVIKGFRKWLYLPDPEVLSVLYGSCFANRLGGDPTWLFLVAPPGGSKTELLMTLSNAPLIMTTTSLTPQSLMSGASPSGYGDPSLLPKLNGKVLVVKDFTTILAMPQIQRDEIFGILRDAYDGKCEKYFGNGVHRSYESLFGVLGGVTNVVEKFSAESSMLGERFMKYRLPHSGNVRAGKHIIRQALRNITGETKMRKDLQEISEQVLNIDIDMKKVPTINTEMEDRIINLAQWVSALRGVVSKERYTGIMQFKPSREYGTRIAKQLAKLGMGVSIFHRRSTLDEESYKGIVSVARSTAPDRVEEIVKQLYLNSREEFVSVKKVAEWTRFPLGTTRDVLEDLDLLSIVAKDQRGSPTGRYRLTKTVLRMMRPLGLYNEDERWNKAKRKSDKKKNED